MLNEDYAIRIARDWNVPASGVGYVTRFDVRRGHLDRYEVQQVGGRTILEYWIPAEERPLPWPARTRPGAQAQNQPGDALYRSPDRITSTETYGVPSCDTIHVCRSDPE